MNTQVRRVIFPVAASVLIVLLSIQTTFAKPQWQTMTLKNGLQVIVIENRLVPLVTVEIAVKNGSYTEPPEFNGLSHLYEHMFFRGNEKSVQPGYSDNLGGLGIARNATTREEVVNYFATALRNSLRTTLVLMRDAIRYPIFDQKELESEQAAVLDEFSRFESDPGFVVKRAVEQKLWYKYFSRKNPLGQRDVIQTSTSAKMKTIQQKFYLPNNSALVITGDVNTAEAFKLAEELFGDWPRGEDPFIKNPLVQHPPLERSEAVIVTQPVQAASVSINWHGPSTDTDAPATYAADVFSYILSQPDSRFKKNLVDSGLTTAVTIGYYTQRNVGPISLPANVQPDKLKAAIKAIFAEIAKFDLPDYFTDEQLESAKTVLEAQESFQREKPSEYAHTVSFWWASSGLDYYATYVENLRKVTRADLKRYVEKYIKGKPYIIGVMLSEEDKNRIGLTEKDLLVR